MNAPDLHKWIADIMSRDAITFEDAYWAIRPSPELAVPLILEKMRITHDAYTRGKLIELLGESEDASVIPILEDELNHVEESIREWARGAIQALTRGDRWQQDPKY